jgi:hypothetical protein
MDIKKNLLGKGGGKEGQAPSWWKSRKEQEQAKQATGFWGFCIFIKRSTHYQTDGLIS